ncbi:hypothetical protein [Alicyclobacillus fastidiosus]|uniref:Uncharacterized protein n=1 Tax=Alicyclobacillus fastidiosus TaxID=392011 RepID=A0ABV5AK06_9BACL|nr:hypothetical protein [Alicyclobacillus fastidiosus]WEH08016.1 hypothetical protein PYS47_14795 [Alicyclobacillus fastidiosus]
MNVTSQTLWHRIGQWLATFPIPLPVFLLVLVYVSFSLIYPKIRDKIKEGSRGERVFRVALYSIIMLLTGYFGRPEIKSSTDKPFHIGEVDVPAFLDWFVLIAISFAVIQVLITLLSMNVYQGILPDSLQPVSRSKQRLDKLTMEYQVTRRFTEVAADWTRLDMRTLLRDLRLNYQDSSTFLQETLRLYMNLVADALMDDGIQLDYELLLPDEVQQANGRFITLSSPMQEVAKGAVRAWAKAKGETDIAQGEDYAYDPSKPESFAALVVSVEAWAVVVTVSANQVIPSGAFENLLLLFRSIVSSDDIWNYERVHKEYLDWLGTEDAIQDYLWKTVSEDESHGT